MQKGQKHLEEDKLYSREKRRENIKKTKENMKSQLNPSTAWRKKSLQKPFVVAQVDTKQKL